MKTPVGLTYWFALAALAVPALAQTGTDDEAVKLDPFKIQATEATGYGVQDASSSSRMNLAYIDVPQTVTVLTNELLTDLQTSVSRDAFQWAQNITVGGNTSNFGSYMLRGLTINSAYRDGFLTSTSRDERDSALYDRIEVVSGPASAAIGRGQAGGLINYVLKKPITRDFINVSATFGTDDYKRFELDVNKSFRKVSVRLPAFWEDGDGTYGGALNHNRKYGVAPSLLWQISSTSQLLIDASAWRNEGPGLSSEVDYLDKTGTIFRLRQTLGQYVNSAWNPFQYPLPPKDNQAWGYPGGPVGNNNNVGEFSAVFTTKPAEFVDLRFGLFADAAQDLVRFFQKSPNTNPDPTNPNNFLQPLNYLLNFYNSMQVRQQGDALFKHDFWGTKNQIDIGYDMFDLRSGAKSGQTSVVNGVLLTDQFYNPQHTPPPGFDFYTSAQLTAKSITRQKGIGYYVQYLGQYWGDRIMINAGVRQDNTATSTYNVINKTYALNASQVTHAPRYSITYKPTSDISIYYLRSYQQDPPVTTLQYTTFQASGGAVLPPPGDPRYTTYITGQTKAVLDEVGVKGNFFSGRITATFDYYKISQDGALASTPVNDPSQATPEHPQALLVWGQTYLTHGVLYHGFELSVSGKLGKNLTFLALYTIPEGQTLFNGVLAPGSSLIRQAKGILKYRYDLTRGTGLEFTLAGRVLLGNWTIRSNSAVKMLDDQEGIDAGISYFFHNHQYSVRVFGHNLTNNPQFDSTNNNEELRRYFATFSVRL